MNALLIAAVVIVVILILAYFMWPRGAWSSLKNRDGLSDEEWAKKIFGALRMNPGQQMEGAIVPLVGKLTGMNVLPTGVALDFANASAYWYPSQTQQSGLYDVKAAKLVGF